MNTKNKDTLAAESWAKRILKSDIRILDTETTGLGTNDQICQIGICDGRGNIVMDTLVKPAVPINRKAFQIHGISEEALRDAPRFPDIYEELVNAVSYKPVIIYNVNFDRQMIRQTCDFYNLRYPRCREFHCAMQWYSQWHGWKKRKDGTYRWRKLPGGDHSAIGDCLAVLKLIQKMAGYNLGEEAEIIPLAR